MTSTRSYRGARSVDEAVEELERCKGTQFDPVMVEALVVGARQRRLGRGRPVPADLPPRPAARRSFGSDDDDPTAVTALGLGGPLEPGRCRARTPTCSTRPPT